MAEEERRGERESGEEAEAQEDDLLQRFPDLPPGQELPEPPKLSHLIPRPVKPPSGSIEPGSYNKMAIAATAASSFIMPILVLSVAGWWLDEKLHTKPWLAFGGVVLGFIAGTVSLLNVIKRLEEPPRR